MTKYTFGDPSASNILVQMVDDHDLAVIESEAASICKLAGPDFFLIAMKVDSWNDDLSPWKAPAVFGNEDFGCGAEETLQAVLSELDPVDRNKNYFIGGYSLAGLFALWSAYQTDIFTGVASASPSIWFPGFLDYMKEHALQAGSVCLSLGDREEKTRNPVMSTVGNCIREAYEMLDEAGVICVLEWNKGNHFREPDLRTAKAFAWVMQNAI
ncbi:MAG: esterase [Lachnospiraceae bacterium]|nr:esterase [Lachnospiraceae bacterium]